MAAARIAIVLLGSLLLACGGVGASDGRGDAATSDGPVSGDAGSVPSDGGFCCRLNVEAGSFCSQILPQTVFPCGDIQSTTGHIISAWGCAFDNAGGSDICQNPACQMSGAVCGWNGVGPSFNGFCLGTVEACP
jgi:hypothetical protein